MPEPLTPEAMPRVPPMTPADWRRAFEALRRAGVSCQGLAASFRRAGEAMRGFQQAYELANEDPPP